MIPPDPSRPDPPGADRRWRELHHRMLGCTRCVEAGLLPRAAPLFQGRPGQRLMLVGQAPGVVEVDVRKPFAGRSGAELARWMRRAGFRDDDHFRSLTYVTSVTKCYPGKARSGSGDRRPGPAEVALCLPWLEAQLELMRPRLVLVVGSLAMAHLLPRRPLPGLEALVGRMFDAAGREVGSPGPALSEPLLLPLPHPSGASRWLNDDGHRRLLAAALDLLAATWPGLAGVK
jgi:uracil-DNA glycosylase family 4